jgi:hypothetical protein
METSTKKRRKIWLLIWILIILWYGIYFVGCGFSTDSDLSFKEYEYSQEKDELTLKTIIIPSSIGYVRGYKSSQTGEKLFLTFYKCFWGINSSLGAKDSFTVKVSPEIEEIYVWEGENAHLFLKKNAENGERIRK